jgi:predicted kinase
LRSDAVRKHLGGVPLEQKGGADLYTSGMTQKTYERLLELGAKLAEQGFTAILDAKYDRQELRQAAISEAQTHKLPLQIFHCTAPEEVLRNRLNRRTGDIADATADLMAAQQAAWEPFTDAEKACVTTVDTTKDFRSLEV